jgi:hypothetical protein
MTNVSGIHDDSPGAKRVSGVGRAEYGPVLDYAARRV